MRFPEFEGEWKTCAFSDIGTFSKGAGISKEQLTEDGTPCILYGELYTQYKNEIIKEIKSKTSMDTNGLVFSKANDVIIPSSGETAIDISTASCIMLDGVLLGGDLNIIRPHKHNGSFLSYQLNGKRKHDIAKIAQGSSIIHLYNESLKKIKIGVPTDIKEEDKMVALLSLLNDRIATQSQIIKELETLMKGLSNKIFSQKQRFKGFDSEWKEKTLGDVLTEPKQIAVDNPDKIELLTVKLYCKGVENTGKHPALTPGGRPYYRRFKNEILIGKQNFHNGGIGIVKEVNDGKICSNAISSYCVLTDNLNFIYYYISRSEYYSKVGDLIGGTGQKEISKAMLLGLEILIPSQEEQIKIANFLSAIDEKLETERRILKSYTDQKKYLLANMFI